MSLLSSEKWPAAKLIAEFGYTNPFTPRRVEIERELLGSRSISGEPVLRVRPGVRVEDLFGNLPKMRDIAIPLANEMRERLQNSYTPEPEELRVYESLCLFLLYSKHMNAFDDFVLRFIQTDDWDGKVDRTFWKQFHDDYVHYLGIEAVKVQCSYEATVIFAGFFQVERAFIHIYHRILGGSDAASRLRAAVWESIFTCEMRSYLESLHQHMKEIPTLITGPSGSGKELVAQAIGNSGFIPFDPSACKFEISTTELCNAVNLSALSPNLIESEIFGHGKAAFNGAIDRPGRLEVCPKHGALFLDEIGELDAKIQVKLLRLLETGEFQRVGSSVKKEFSGKIIAATNCDLEAEIHAGRFRPDFYFRLCADLIQTPSLAEQLHNRPDDLEEMVRFIAKEIHTKGTKLPSTMAVLSEVTSKNVDRLTNQAVEWINSNLDRAYDWPGNFRELGQCVRNVMIRGTYRPSVRSSPKQLGAVDQFFQEIRNHSLTSNQLLGRYYALVYSDLDTNYKLAGERLGVDWRVVKRRIDHEFFERISDPKGSSMKNGRS